MPTDTELLNEDPQVPLYLITPPVELLVHLLVVGLTVMQQINPIFTEKFLTTGFPMAPQITVD